MVRSRTTLALMCAIAIAAPAGATFASATPTTTAEDGADTFNVAAGTTVTGTNVGQVVFTAPAHDPYIVTCSLSTFTGTTGSKLRVGIAPPVFANGTTGQPCADNYGGTDTFVSNTDFGKWSLHENDYRSFRQGDEGLPEPNARGDKMVLSIPRFGLTDTRPECVLYFASSGEVDLQGRYNDNGTVEFTNSYIPVHVYFAESGCPLYGGFSATLTVTFNLNPAIFDVG